MKKLSVLCISLFFVLSVNAQKAAKKPFATSGQFSNITMGSISGDLGGTMVYLTQSDNRTYALVTFGAGVLFPPVLVEAKVSGPDMRTFEFSLPPRDGNGDGRSFKAIVKANNLELNEQGNRSNLKRMCGAGGSKTYSNITVGKESGDFGGIEVYLTDSDGDWFALVTIAEGVIKAPQLVEAKVIGKTSKKVEFTVPNDNGGRKFTGMISSKSGTLTLNERGSRSILKAKCYK